MKKYYLVLIILLIFSPIVTPQFGSLYSFLEDEGLFDENEEQPRPRTVTRVISSKDSKEDTLDREQRVVTDLGQIVSQTNDLFSKLMGVIGGEIGGNGSRDQTQTRLGDQINRVKQSLVDRKGESRDSTVNRVFNLFDTISSIPFRARRVHGAHVCVREITSELSSVPGRLRSEHGCQRFRKAQKCIEVHEDSAESRETARIEECCHGWDTDDIITHGCSIEEEVLSLEDRLHQFNYTGSEIRSLGLENVLHSRGKLTLLIPQRVHKEPILGKAMILSDIQKDYDWSDGDLIETVDGLSLHINQQSDYSQVITSINCVPLIRANVPVMNGIIHLTGGIVHPAAKTLIEAMEMDGGFTIFLSLLNRETRALLSSLNQKHTIFAIRDVDFSKMSKSLQDQIRQKGGCARDLVLSHIFKSAVCLNSLPDKNLFSLDGNMRQIQEIVSRNGSTLMRIGASRVIDGNLVAGNGVIHVIDDVIDPQQLLTWRDHLNVNSPSMLKSLDDLNIEDPVTILIPKGASNQSVSFDAKDHVIIGKTLNLMENGLATTLNGKKLFYGRPKKNASPILMRISFGHSSPNSPRIGCSNVVDTPINACNSVVYFLDKPVEPSSMSILEYLSSRDDLNQFTRLIKSSGLEGFFENRKSPITLFVPTNDAFSNNELKRLISNSSLASSFVKRFIVNEPLCKSDLAHSRSEIKVEIYENLNGEGLVADGSEDRLFIDGAPIIESELLLKDGLIYVLESIIPPKTRNSFHGNRGLSSSSSVSQLPLSLLNIFAN